jgi:phage head maturation protease
MSNLSQAERDKLPASSFGDPEGRKFPIVDQDDVDSAAHLIGKASDPEKVKARIVAIARRKGLSIPDAWKEDGGKSLAGGGDTLVCLGGELKALGEAKVGGYLIRFTGPESPDLCGDYFSAETFYNLDDDGTGKAFLLYNHGMDLKVGKRRIGKGTLRQDDVGVWLEAQLDLRDEYEQAIMDMARQDKLGLSSGSAGHLVEREPDGKAFRITSWPIIEASLTPTPAEPRNGAFPLKSLFDFGPGTVAAPTPVPMPTLAERSDRAVADLEELLGLFDAALKARESEGRSLSPAKWAALKALNDRAAAILARRPADPAEIAARARLRLLALKHKHTPLPTASR